MLFSLTDCFYKNNERADPDQTGFAEAIWYGPDCLAFWEVKPLTVSEKLIYAHLLSLIVPITIAAEDSLFTGKIKLDICRCINGKLETWRFFLGLTQEYTIFLKDIVS